MTVTTAVVVLPRRMAGWATRRALARNSLTGIELACSLCAAVWFSAGTPLAALGGGVALGGGYLTRRVGGQLTAGAFDGWLASACALAGELAVYTGLAAGAATGRTDVWALATGAAVLLGLRKVVRLCRNVAPPPDKPQGSAPRVLAGRLLALPAGERAVVITVTAALYGARITLLTLACWGAVAVAWAMAAAPRAGGYQRRAAATGVAACRDDGPIARFAGQVVQGQLVPLPPAVAGLTATVLLATLGMADLAGPVLLTPVAAMLLAAPGSAHPHDGPLDWLAPPVVQAGQYVYLAALGAAMGVPGPVTFGLVSLAALWQLDVAYQARHQMSSPGRRTGLGWEGRMLAAGLGAMLGIATVTYLALAAYLGWLLCRSTLVRWFAASRG